MWLKIIIPVVAFLLIIIIGGTCIVCCHRRSKKKERDEIQRGKGIRTLDVVARSACGDAPAPTVRMVMVPQISFDDPPPPLQRGESVR